MTYNNEQVKIKKNRFDCNHQVKSEKKTHSIEKMDYFEEHERYLEEKLREHFSTLEFLQPFFASRDQARTNTTIQGDSNASGLTVDLPRLEYIEKECKSCGKTFETPRGLAAHRRGLANFECCICNHDYQLKLPLDAHILEYCKNPNGPKCCVWDNPYTPESIKFAHLSAKNCPKKHTK